MRQEKQAGARVKEVSQLNHYQRVTGRSWSESCYWSMMRHGQKLKNLGILYNLTGNLLAYELEKN